MRGQVARRTVRHFGFDYDYESWELVEADPLPEPLLVVRERAAALAGLEPEALAQALVTRYPPGAGIGSHRDAPIFGPEVVGVSLRAPCVMRFRRSVGGVRYGYDLVLEPRSAYVLGGKARSAWKHEIPPAKELRYSITFRTVRSRTLRRTGSA
jgi:alkylated DNA repair dioxygenase AlkB